MSDRLFIFGPSTTATFESHDGVAFCRASRGMLHSDDAVFISAESYWADDGRNDPADRIACWARVDSISGDIVIGSEC